MVKADGYGLGAVRVARALERHNDPWGFGVATIAEGEALRIGYIRRPVIVFTPALAEHQHRYRELDLQAVLDDPDVIRAWSLPYQLEIDTGMARSGVRWDDPDIAHYRTAKLHGAFMHFHSAEDDLSSVLRQFERFKGAVDRLGPRPMLLYVANSAGVWRLEESLDLVRPGMFLYGCRIAGNMPMPKPVATLRSRVVSVRMVKKFEGVSYGGEWVAPRDSRIATVAFGYADGLHRSVQGKAQVLIGGRRFPLVGRITMDMVMADVTDGGEAVARGDRVTLVGTDEPETITWEDLAGWAGTNTYEMMSRLGTRVERLYVED
jgi:alanine racemase